MKFSDLCTPAAIYLVLSTISVIFQIFTQFQFFSILFHILFVLAWTWILNFLCKKGYATLSWILLILPYIFVFGLIALGAEMIGSSKKHMMIYQQVPMQAGNQIPTYNNSLPAYRGGGAV